MLLTLAVPFTQVLVLVQVLGTTVRLVPVTLSLSVADAQSKVMVSGQNTRYQSDSEVAPAGSVKVCTKVLFVLGLELPSVAAYVPVCGKVVAAATPAGVHPESVPVSKPGFTT